MSTEKQITDQPTDERNRFAEVLEKLREKSDCEESLSQYEEVLEMVGDTDNSEPVPFPYGGVSDFGKWVADEL